MTFCRKTKVSGFASELKNLDKLTLVFSHHSLLPENIDGNYWKETYKQNYAHCTNYKDYLTELSATRNIRALFNAHCHWLSLRQDYGIPRVTLPAFSDKFISSQADDVSPMVFTMIDLSGDEIRVDCFAEKYVYASLSM